MMPTEKEILMVQKATAYDLLKILESQSDKSSFTFEELKNLIDSYIIGAAK